MAKEIDRYPASEWLSWWDKGRTVRDYIVVTALDDPTVLRVQRSARAAIPARVLAAATVDQPQARLAGAHEKCYVAYIPFEAR